MIKYKFINKSSDIQKNLKAIEKLWEEWFEYCNELDWVLIFNKKVVSKIDREKKEESKSKEFIEFAKLYSTIKNSWLSDEKLISKYNKLVWQHQDIMDWLNRYIKKIKAENIAKNFILMASTFINQERYKDEFTIMENRVWYSQKWLIPLLQDLPEEKAQIIVDKIREREKKTNKECNESIAKNIINSIIW